MNTLKENAGCEEYEKQIREDAIDEFAERLISHMDGERFSKEMLVVFIKNNAERLKREKYE